MALRNVISTNAAREVDEDYADQVDEILAHIDEVGHPGHVLRETYSKDGDRLTWQARLVSYPAPGTGEQTFAATYYDTASREVEEGTLKEAEARYEEFVQETDAATRIGGDADDYRDWFAFSDVDGVLAAETPDGHNPHAVVVQVYPDSDILRDWMNEADRLGIDAEHVGADSDGDPLVRTPDGQFYALVVIERGVTAVPVEVVKVTS